jgi:hypothetical protein
MVSTPVTRDQGRYIRAWQARRECIRRANWERYEPIPTAKTSPGGWGVSNGSGGGATRGGARPQTAEIIKTFNQRCPEYTITNNKERANYAVILGHEGGKGLLRHRNKIAVFNHDGDAIFSDSTRELGNPVKDARAAITKDLATQKK